LVSYNPFTMRRSKPDEMRILCLIPSLGAGGAERVMAHLVSHLTKKHSVSLLVWDNCDRLPFYPLPQTIRFIRADLLGGANLLHRFWRICCRIKVIREEARYSKADVVLSFMDTMNITALLSLFGMGCPLVVSERVDPAKHNIGAIKSVLRRLLYPYAACCIVPTQRIRNYFSWMPTSAVSVIPNPVVLTPMHAVPDKPDARGRFRIIAVGRLEEQKGFDVLVDAFAEVAPAHPGWDLLVFGDGPMRARIEAQVRGHLLENRIYLPGTTPNIQGELAKAHILAFPSRYEGFPNALAEGLAVGLPAVGYAGVSGVEELIVHDQNGFLVAPLSNRAALVEALKTLIADPGLRTRFGMRARERMDLWRAELICDAWERRLIDVVGSTVTSGLHRKVLQAPLC
jgi:GalNAc-alpha-(1->4)-GalNAc-alpha-(1->3)-diNAcBac-PP-undecaprenol alpha-1,4-N-acetyl-D-galactosaminyltransferase